MSSTQATQHTPKSVRLWPGVAAVTLLWLTRFAVPLVAPEAALYAVIGGLAGGVLVLLWWLLLSRIPWLERIAAVAIIVAAVYGMSFAVHESVSNGMMGMMLPIFSVPFLSMALVVWAAVRPRLSGSVVRLSTMAAVIVLSSSVMTLVRTGGISGTGISDIHWRWTETPEERLLAREGRESDAPRNPPAARAADSGSGAPAAPSTNAPVSPLAPSSTGPSSTPAAQGEQTAASASDHEHDEPVEPPPAAGVDHASNASHTRSRADWPGFRGAARDGVVRGVRIETDWSRKPPVELWRRPIGPGWSSFAVQGDFIYTQEQRGDDEVVSCYRLTTGEPVWRHRDAVRFWESNGGAGPRGTPTLSNGRVYAFGATGLLSALDAATGTLIWSRNVQKDTEVAIPDWGFSSSPVVYNDVVVVAASGRLAAYDITNGRQRWLGPAGGGGYSSPHLMTIDGVDQIVHMRGGRTLSLAPADGSLLWDHNWQPAVSIVQPALVGERDILIGAGDGMGGNGMRRVSVARRPNGWNVEERWTSRNLKPYFNDLVVHKGHAYGFDGAILAAIDLADGSRKWKGGRYGHGQFVLIADQDLLLVLAEEGELVLVSATPDQFKEIAKVPAIDGKTWNHPVLVGDVVLVRNGEEMAAFRLPLAAE